MSFDITLYVFIVKWFTSIYVTTLYNLILMPQLVPFFFINEVAFTFTIIVVLIYFFSKYILPRFVRLFATRVFISKL